MELFLFWFILAILSGVYANKLNRSGIGYFLLSCFLSPIIGFVALLVLGYKIDTVKQDNDNKIYEKYRVTVELNYDDALKKALAFYEEYDLYPSEYNTDDDYEKKFKNDNGQYFIINKANDSVFIESCNLPKFKDITPIVNNLEKSTIDDLVKLGELFEKGLLTQQEFDTQKAKLLNA